MRKLIAIIVVFATALAASDTASAQSRGLSLIRDAEIESAIRRMSEPVFNAAGIAADDVTIALIEDNRINAFVAGGMNLFIHTGLLIRTEDPLELIGVVAHETGHIAGGHLVRTREAIENASIQAILATVLGVAAAIGGGDGNAGAAVMMGGAELARRGFMQFSRGQESSADQAALTYLEGAQMSPRGMVSFLRKLESEELLPQSRQTEYVRTHPLTRDRVDAVQQGVERSRYRDRKLPAEFYEMHRRMKAKLLGFIQPQVALRVYSEQDQSFAARYARAIATYKRGDVQAALPMVEALIAAEPQNPFLHELKGQILFENGRVVEAIQPYRTAVQLMPDSGLLRIALGHALIETNNLAALDEAVQHLTAAARQERKTPSLHRLLAIAYGKRGEDGLARLHLAEEAILQQKKDVARMQATAAQRTLPVGSPGWMRSQDIMRASEKEKS